MAEEIIIKVEGLGQIKEIETSIKAFTTSINAAIQAISVSGGNKSLSNQIRNITKETTTAIEQADKLNNALFKSDSSINNGLKNKSNSLRELREKLAEVTKEADNLEYALIGTFEHKKKMRWDTGESLEYLQLLRKEAEALKNQIDQISSKKVSGASAKTSDDFELLKLSEKYKLEEKIAKQEAKNLQQKVKDESLVERILNKRKETQLKLEEEIYKQEAKRAKQKIDDENLVESILNKRRETQLKLDEQIAQQEAKRAKQKVTDAPSKNSDDFELLQLREKYKLEEKISQQEAKNTQQKLNDESLVERVLNKRIESQIKLESQEAQSSHKRSANAEQEKYDNQILQKQLKDEIILNSSYSTALDKAGASLRILQREIDSLVASGQTETAQYREKFAQLKRMSEEYVRLEKATGKAQMKSTGMYGATYQLTQVMRELPNFAIDARIGFLSLSNNLPMLMDSFKQISMEIDDVTGKAKGMKGAWITMGKSLLSLNTVFIIATTLLTLYGDKIVDWIGSLFNANKEIKRTYNAMQDLNKVFKGGAGEFKSAYENINKVKAALLNSKDGLSEYNKTFGDTFGKANSVAEALDLIKSKEKAYTDAMKNMAIANALFSSSAENAVKIADIKTMSNAELLGKDAQKYIDKINEWQENIITLRKAGIPTEDSIGQLKLWTDKYNLAAKEKRDKLIAEEEEAYNKRTKLATKYFKTANEIANKSDINLVKSDAVKSSSKEKGTKLPIVEFNEDEADAYFESVNKWYAKWLKSLQDKGDEFGKLLDKDVQDANQANINRIEQGIKEQEANRKAMMETITSIATISDSIAGMYDARIERLNSYYDLEEARIEGSTMSEKAKNDALKKLDEKRYREELKLFEQRKQFQIATVWMDASVGIMNAWTEKSVAISPFDVILRIAKTAAILAQATAQTSNIASQKPNAPKAISGGTTSSVSTSIPALTPTKTALNSNEDNLNMLLGANKSNISPEVKVSEINKVQNRVKVRETNQSY